VRSIAMAADLVARAWGALASYRAFAVLTWSGMLALIVLSVIPAADRPVTGLPQDFEHVVAYGVIGICAGLGFKATMPVRFAAAIAFAGAVELAQVPLSTRHARLDDFVVDAVGACVGIMVGTLVRMAARDKA
jgi:VanZ family protein